MGLMPSSDIFNISSDNAIRGLELTLKSVDDFLTSAKGWGELKDRMGVLFKRFRELNIKVKPSKLWLGTKVMFGGFQVEAPQGEVPRNGSTNGGLVPAPVLLFFKPDEKDN